MPFSPNLNRYPNSRNGALANATRKMWVLSMTTLRHESSVHGVKQTRDRLVRRRRISWRECKGNGALPNVAQKLYAHLNTNWTGERRERRRSFN